MGRQLDLRQALKSNILIGDGAMGTLLYQHGFPVGISYEELNLTRPEVIADIHRSYYEAGARIIETNTFSATREKLSKYGLEREVEAINREGAQIARKAVGSDAYVVGAVGSIRSSKRSNVHRDILSAEFSEQIEGLLSGDVDGIMLETFYELEEMRIALQIVRSRSSLPVICQFATEGNGNTRDGYSFAEAIRILKDEGADAAGFNCHSGPSGIMRTMSKLGAERELPYSVFPNAGLPSYVDGRLTYGSTADYFAERAVSFADLGARIIGGCCGTTPEHIAAMADALAGYEPKLPESRQDKAKNRVRPAAAKPLEVTDGNQAGRKHPTIVDLVKERHTVIVEWDTPRDLDISKFMEGSRALKEIGVDSITMADNALAITRMSNLPLGYMVKEKLGMRPLLHIACRDRNLIGTQSHLMGLHALGIDHVLVITGDPSRVGDLPDSSSVYDLNSFEMIRMIKQLNNGLAFSGRTLKQKANFIVGAAFNPNVRNLDKMVQRLERKIEAGADYIMTQPVYDHRLIEQVYEVTKHLDVPVFLGIMPLVSGGNAEFMHNEVPGVKLSDDVRRRMDGLRGEEGRKMGVQIAKELLDTAIRYFNGIYLMTPMSFYEMTVQLTDYVWQKTARRDSHLSPLSK